MTGGDRGPTNQQADTQTRVAQWLNQGGYPLEFQTASIVRRCGYQPQQGTHVQNGEKQREVDVYFATKTRGEQGAVLVGCVIECKMSIDKPWVLFCSNDFKMTPEMIVAQMISSESGDAALWMARAEEAVSALGLFNDPTIPAFSAARAFSGENGKDMCYEALQAVIGNTVAKAREYARTSPQGPPGQPFIGFPLIVINAPLFKASFNESTGEMELEEVSRGRLYWKGSNDWPYTVLVDIVTIGNFEPYLLERREEQRIFRQVLASSWATVREALTNRPPETEIGSRLMSTEGSGRTKKPWIIEQIMQRAMDRN